MQYEIVTDQRQKAFEEKVASMLNHGWKLVGGVALSTDVDRGRGGQRTKCYETYAQAMVKESPKGG